MTTDRLWYEINIPFIPFLLLFFLKKKAGITKAGALSCQYLGNHKSAVSLFQEKRELNAPKKPLSSFSMFTREIWKNENTDSKRIEVKLNIIHTLYYRF